MGLDVAGKIIIGELVRRKTLVVVTKKFDPDTGIPFMKKEERQEWFLENGSKITPDPDGDFFHYSDYEWGIAVQGYELEDTSTELRTTNENKRVRSICLIRITELINKYVVETGREPKVYNLLYVSY